MILGNKLENPYTLQNMNNANHALGNFGTLFANRYYVKLTPQNYDEATTVLADSNVNNMISEYPIDYEVLYEGDVYLVDGKTSDTIVKPYYCVTTSLSNLPSNISYQLLGTGYVPTDAQETLEIKAFQLAGYNVDSLNGFSNVDPNRRFAYKPEGYVDVYKTSSYVPVRNKSLVMTTFFKWSYVRTDQNGYFKSSKNFIVPVPVHIRHWNQEYKIFGHSLWDKIGTATKNNIGSHYQISISTDKGAYNKAVINNTFFDYNDFCNSSVGGYGTIRNLNDVWLWVPLSSVGSGSTILKHVFGFSGFEIPLAQFGAALYFDFNFRFWNFSDYQTKQSLMFHEFSHYSHALIAGRSYWKDVDNAEAQNILATTFSGLDPYRDGLHPTVALANTIRLTESWSEFMSIYITTYYYGNIYSFIEYVNPKPIPYAFDFYNSWLPTGLWWDLNDAGLENFQATVTGGYVIDNVSLPILTLYNALSGMVDIESVMRIISAPQNPTMQISIRNLAGGYGAY